MHDACFGEVMNLGGKNHFIISEMLNYYRFNPNTLEIAEKFNTIKTFGLTSLNPIPIRDHFTGDLYNVGTCLSGAGMVKYSILKLKNPSADFGNTFNLVLHYVKLKQSSNFRTSKFGNNLHNSISMVQLYLNPSMLWCHQKLYCFCGTTRSSVCFKNCIDKSQRILHQGLYGMEG